MNSTILWIGPDQSDRNGSIRDRLIATSDALIVRNHWRGVTERPVGLPIDLVILSRTRSNDGVDRRALRRTLPAAEWVELRGPGVAPTTWLPGRDDSLPTIDADSAWWSLHRRLFNSPEPISPRSIAVISHAAEFAETWLDWLTLDFPDAVLRWQSPGQRAFTTPEVCLWDSTGAADCRPHRSIRHAVVGHFKTALDPAFDAVFRTPADPAAVSRWIAVG